MTEEQEPNLFADFEADEILGYLYLQFGKEGLGEVLQMGGLGRAFLLKAAEKLQKAIPEAAEIVRAHAEKEGAVASPEVVAALDYPDARYVPCLLSRLDLTAADRAYIDEHRAQQ